MPGQGNALNHILSLSFFLLGQHPRHSTHILLLLWNLPWFLQRDDSSLSIFRGMMVCCCYIFCHVSRYILYGSHFVWEFHILCLFVGFLKFSTVIYGSHSPTHYLAQCVREKQRFSECTTRLPGRSTQPASLAQGPTFKGSLETRELNAATRVSFESVSGRLIERQGAGWSQNGLMTIAGQ